MGIGKKCGIKNCNLEASYNWKNSNIRKYCSNHKKPGMINKNAATPIDAPANKSYIGVFFW